MRIGQNPAKSLGTVTQPTEITVVVVVYIPFLSGYYSQALQVLELCLESIAKNTQLPYDLMVFDNASCQAVRDYLSDCHQQGKIQYLILSDKNVGKVGAWNFAFGAAPGKYIAYADSDVYHFPGWLAPQIETLDLLPNAGMVTGMPLLAPEELSSATVTWAEQNPDVEMERGQFISWGDYMRHSGTLGRSEETVRDFYESNPIVRIRVGGKQFFASASHFQFVSRKEILQKVFPLSADRPMGQVRQMDTAINKLGYLRLSLPEWYIQHIGNTLPENQPKEKFEEYLSLPQHAKLKPRKSLWSNQVIQKVLRWIYDKIFNLLHEN